MATALLLVTWILFSAAHATLFRAFLVRALLLTPFSCCWEARAKVVVDNKKTLSFLNLKPLQLRPQLLPNLYLSSSWTAFPKIPQFKLVTSGEIAVYACRPRPKKEKARRNYRIAKEQKQKREERAVQRRRQLEVFRAQQQLLSVSGTNSFSQGSGKTANAGGLAESLLRTDRKSLTTEQAAAGLPPALQGHLASRVNYCLVGGTWRRATGAAKYVRLPGAELAAVVFRGLPIEEVADAVAKAKRQDAGYMDIEAYDDADTQHATLEGVT